MNDKKEVIIRLQILLIDYNIACLQNVHPSIWLSTVQGRREIEIEVKLGYIHPEWQSWGKTHLKRSLLQQKLSNSTQRGLKSWQVWRLSSFRGLGNKKGCDIKPLILLAYTLLTLLHLALTLVSTMQWMTLEDPVTRSKVSSALRRGGLAQTDCISPAQF